MEAGFGITCLYDIEDACQSKGVCHAGYIDDGQGVRAPKITYSKQNTDLLAIANGSSSVLCISWRMIPSSGP